MAEIIGTDGTVRQISRSESLAILDGIATQDAKIHAFVKSICGDKYRFRDGHPDGGLNTERAGYRRWISIRYGSNDHIWPIAAGISRGKPIEFFVRNGACYHVAHTSSVLFPKMIYVLWLPQRDIYGRRQVGEVAGLWECNETSWSSSWTAEQTALCKTALDWRAKAEGRDDG